MKNPYLWPMDENGKPKSIGQMTLIERARADVVLVHRRNARSFDYLSMLAFLEQQIMISESRLAEGGPDLYDDDGVDFR